jgi:hypothetical protein
MSAWFNPNFPDDFYQAAKQPAGVVPKSGLLCQRRPEDELAARDQLMNVVTDANVNHVQTVRILRARKKKFRLA